MMLSNLSVSIAEDKIQLPPIPDEKENSKTLLGIDVNKNGVRDDVEHYIYDKITKEEDVFNAYLQSARTEQQMLMNYPKKKEIQKLRMKSNRDIQCIKLIDKNSELNAQNFSGITSLTFNTPKRRNVDKWMAFNDWDMRAPGVLKDLKLIKREEVCDF